ncbi:MAG: sulfatase [Verrucomicrobiales bacterium]|nr:sulfatase [Verrucomicrobiales bacterium]
MAVLTESGEVSRMFLMTCRYFLLICLFLLIFPAKGEERPNILFAFADDWGRYASIYTETDGEGTINDLIETPNIDRIAREGILFNNAFVTSPSCTPCRSSLLSGQYFFRTGQGAILQGAIWDPEIPSFPLLLKDNGYHIGKLFKVWGPGEPKDAPFGEQEFGFEIKGPSFNGFSQHASKAVEKGDSVEEAKGELLNHVEKQFDGFLNSQPDDKPFFFWFGPTNVHRKWIRGSGKDLWALEPDELKGKMPAFLPDVPEVREDLADYLGEAMAFDAAVGVLLRQLEAAGKLDDTLIVVSGDHGAPGFPRGKCNLYDFGSAVTLAARWGNGRIPGNRVVEDFVNLMDLAPTFLEAGGTEIPDVMTGRSLIDVFTSEKSGLVDPARTWVVTGRERHVAEARAGNKPYPQRAIRTEEHLYIVNFEPERWPMGSPGSVANHITPDHEALVEDTFVVFGDLDAGPTKAWMVENRDHTDYQRHFQLGFGKRPEVELYVLAEDPDQVDNRAGDPALASIEKELRERLMKELTAAGDPRLLEDPVRYESMPFTGPNPPKPKR